MNTRIVGAGLGLRRQFCGDLLSLEAQAVDFVELAPENWIGVGGSRGRQLQLVAERYPLVCHGLSLSIGGPAPLDLQLLADIKAFLDRYGVLAYTEHLSYCSDERGHLYDLMPIPFTEEAVAHVAGRIRQAQDFLKRRIGIENVSCYAAPGQEMPEVEFINGVLRAADCDLLLDLNNLYVNSVNFHYDPHEFLAAIDGRRAVYLHVAGHAARGPNLRVDTHGAPVIDSVWALLGDAYRRFGVRPTVLERDFNIPPLADLLDEVERIRTLQRQVAAQAPRAAASG